jgi:hypothetical protein
MIHPDSGPWMEKEVDLVGTGWRGGTGEKSIKSPISDAISLRRDVSLFLDPRNVDLDPAVCKGLYLVRKLSCTAV